MSFPSTVYLSDSQVRETYATQTMPLGCRGVTADGRIFRYAQAGTTALEKHNVMSTRYTSPLGTATQPFYENYGAGTTHVVLQLGSCTGYEVENYFRDGWLVIKSTDTGHAQQVRIHSHAAPASSTALGQHTTFMLADGGLKFAVTTGTAGDSASMPFLIANPYRYVAASGITTDVVTGSKYAVGVTPVAVAANYYFWLQTWGPALVRMVDGVSSVSNWGAGLYAVVSSGATTGMACPRSTASTSITTDTGLGNMTSPLGVIMVAPFVSGGHAMINLTLAA